MARRKLQLQQGDVWLESAKIPKGATRVRDNPQAILARGEGHHQHQVAAPGSVTLYEKDGVRYARFHADSLVEHVTPDGRPGEHRPVNVPAGDYAFGRVQEWDYLAEMARAVVD